MVRNEDRRQQPAAGDEQTREYEPPRIVAYDESSLLDAIGPAVACARWDPGASMDDEEFEDDL